MRNKFDVYNSEFEATELMKQAHKEITKRRKREIEESKEYYRRMRDAE